MPRCFRVFCLDVWTALISGCADFATPVAVVTPKLEYQGKEPTHIGVACAYKIPLVMSSGDSHIREAKGEGGVVHVATVEVIKKVVLVDSFPLNFFQATAH